jgi:hypothetical protein
MEFLSAPGRLLVSPPGVAISGAGFASCADDRDCGDAEVVPVRYEAGHIEYDVSVDRPMTALFNEAYYRGWSASACVEGSACVDVPVSRSEAGLLEADLPEGDYRLVADYATPGRLAGWVLFGGGIAVGIAAPLALGWRASRERKQGV